jgi:dihydrofolate reductase
VTGAVSTRARQQEPSREGPRIDQASAAAGDKDVVVMGGGDVIRQCVDSGSPTS